MKISTKTGDDGTTGLWGGLRVSNDALRVQAYGTVDETNATIGMVRIHLTGSNPLVDAMLARIQNDLFDLGADLCVPDRGEKLPYQPLRMTDAQVTPDRSNDAVARAPVFAVESDGAFRKSYRYA